jgi:hypothetical protein
MKANLRLKEKEIDKKMFESLLANGFRKNSKDFFLKSINDDTDFLLIVEKSDRETDDTIFINPVVGFADNFVEQVYRELAKVFDTSKELVNTAIVSLGYLMPGNTYRTWNISVTDDEIQTQRIIDDLISSIKLYAISFIGNLIRENKLIEALQNGKLGIQKSNYFKIPVLYFKNGTKTEGLKFAKLILEQQRPTPKDPNVAEPVFSSYEEALGYFRRDKDVRFYFCYSDFIHNYEKL